MVSAAPLVAVRMLQLFLAALIAYVLWLFVYRVTSHPLKNHPGPILGRLSGLYHTYHALNKDHARNFFNLHETYGPVVRYAPNSVSIRSVDAVRMLYTNSRYTRKADSYLAFPRNPEKASLFSSINKQTHARKRRLLRYGFSDAALKAAQPTIKKHVDVLCRSMQYLKDDDQEYCDIENSCVPHVGVWSTPTNFSAWINRFTFDVSSDLSFSKSFEMMRYATNREISKIVHQTLFKDNVTGTALTLLHRWRLKHLFFWRQVYSTKVFDAFIESAASERLGKAGNTSQDFMYWFTDAVAEDKSTDDEKFSMEELIEEGILLITAGSDTSSTAISATMFYLLHNPEKLERLQGEVRSAFSSIQSIEFGAALQSCTYLRACIDEGLRLAPPAGSVLHRQVEPGGVTIEGNHYPSGTNIGVPVYAMHHDETYFTDPFKFQPERWIVGEILADGTQVTPELIKYSSAAFLPFSAGTRGCIGKPLAYLQISILFATLMLKYDIKLCEKAWLNGRWAGKGPDTSEEYDLVDLFISWKNGPLLQIKAREVAE